MQTIRASGITEGVAFRAAGASLNSQPWSRIPESPPSAISTTYITNPIRQDATRSVRPAVDVVAAEMASGPSCNDPAMEVKGLEAASNLRKLFPKTPIILFTLYHNLALETVAAEAGINPVLPKSVPPFHTRRKSTHVNRRAILKPGSQERFNSTWR